MNEMAKDDDLKDSDLVNHNSRSKTDQHSYKERLDELELIRRKKKAEPQKNQAISKKLPKLKKQRFNANKFRAGILIGTFSIVILFMLYLVTPISKINDIKIYGNQQMSTAEIGKSIGVKKGDLIFKVWFNIAKEETHAMKNNPQFKSVRINVVGPRNVTIQIKENKIIGLIHEQNHYYAALSNGEIKKVNQQLTDYDMPIYSGFKSDSVLKATILQMEKIPTSISQNISEVKFDQTNKAPDRLLIYMSDGNEVLVKYTKLAKMMDYYPGIATQMTTPGVVDLQVGAYSYPYGTKDE